MDPSLADPSPKVVTDWFFVTAEVTPFPPFPLWW